MIKSLNPPPVYIEVAQAKLKALSAESGIEVPLERGADGALTLVAKDRVISGLKILQNGKPWQQKPLAYCAIAANGVLLRQLTLPMVEGPQFQRMLALQIENEFPLPADQLAWGYIKMKGEAGGTRQNVLVGVVKKQVVEEYEQLLSGCGFKPVFTIAALARHELCPATAGNYSLVEIEGRRAELEMFTDGVPQGLRVIPAVSATNSAESLGKAMGTEWQAKPVYVSGDKLNLPAQNFISLAMETGPGKSAATLGMKKAVEQNQPLLLLASKPAAQKSTGKFDFAQPEARQWLKRAAILIAVLLLLPYAEALLFKPFLERRLAKLKQDQSRLDTIDHELDFLEYLKQTQPPYLDALYLIAKSGSQGGRVDSITMNRRGDISFRGSMQNGEKITDFRSKLMASGFYTNLIVEEQSPTPDRQKVNVRFNGQWKPAAALAGMSVGPTAAELQQAKTNGAAKPPVAMPPGMPPH